MRYVIAASLLGFLAGCSATDSSSDVSSHAPDASAKVSSLEDLQRFPPRYPKQQAINGTEGCATIEYVVGTDRKVSAVEAVSATNKDFAREARKVVSRWKWQSVSEAAFQTPLKFQTRFEFCLDQGNGNCAASVLATRGECSGDDVIAVVGRRVKYP